MKINKGIIIIHDLLSMGCLEDGSTQIGNLLGRLYLHGCDLCDLVSDSKVSRRTPPDHLHHGRRKLE